jgi:accessory gene regulator protein AgrB
MIQSVVPTITKCNAHAYKSMSCSVSVSFLFTAILYIVQYLDVRSLCTILLYNYFVFSCAVHHDYRKLIHVTIQEREVK